MRTRPLRSHVTSRGELLRGRTARRARRLFFESLEDRRVLATDITILDSGVGTLDGFLSPTDGTITVADGGAASGTVSRAALQGVGAGVSISITAGTSISVSNLTSPLVLQTGAGNSAVFVASGGSFSFTDQTDSITTAGGAINLGATTSLALGSLNSSGGNITLTADDMDLQAAINAGAGTATLQPFSAARAIDLGTETAGKLSLTDAEMDNVTASVLRIGSVNSGNIVVSTAITRSTSPLTIISGADVFENLTGSITATGLRVIAAGDVSLDNGNNVGTLAGNGGTGFVFNNGTNALIIGTVDGSTGIVASNNGFIDIIADNIDIQQQISTGGTVILEPFTATQLINLGGADAVGTLGITDAETNFVTANVLRIGSLANTGGITISSNITRHIGFDTMTLITDGLISQSAPLSVAELAVQSSGADVFLTNALNDVDALAGTADNNFVYTDVSGFVVTGVDVRAGIFLGATDTIILAAGGSVTQDANEIIHAGNLLLLGAGPFAITDAGNDVSTLAAFVTSGVSYTDSNSLSVGAVNAINGVTTLGGDINITASAEVSDTTLTVSQPIISSNGEITLSADLMSFSNTVNAGTGTATLKPTTVGRQIDLGTNPSAGKLALANTDLNQVTAAVIVIGASTAGDITVSAPVSPTGTNQLELVSGRSILNTNAGTDITVTRLGLTAGNVSGAPDADFTVAGAPSLDGFTATGLWHATGTAIGAALTGHTSPDFAYYGIDAQSNYNTGAANSGDLTSGVISIPVGGTSLSFNYRLESEAGTPFDAAQIQVSTDGGATFPNIIASNGGGQIPQSLNWAPLTFSLDAFAGQNIVVRFHFDTVDAVANAFLGWQIDDIAIPGANLVSIIILDTAVSNVEATATGSITLVNTGALAIGGVNDVLTGLKVVTAGDINVTTIAGSVELADTNGLENVLGGSTSGNIFITANGATSDVFSSVDEDAITAPAGSISVSAGRDILFGTVGTDHDNDVRANNNITFIAGRDITVDGFSDVSSDGFTNATGGSIAFTAGRDINVTDNFGNDASVGVESTGSTGSVTFSAVNNVTLHGPVFTDGTGGIFMTADSDTNAAGTFTSSAAGTLSTNGGVTVITAADVTLGGTINVTTANFADVFLQPSTNGAVIHLGTDATFGLTDAELDLITASALIIGTGSNTGGIQWTGPVTLDPAKVPTLELLTAGTGGAITDNTAGELTDVTVQNLLLVADAGIGSGIGGAGDLDITVTTLAAQNASTTAGAINIANTSALLTITGVGTGFFTLFGVFNHNANVGTGTTTIVNGGPITIASTVSSVGSTIITAFETSDAPTFADDLTVNSGATVSVSAGDLTLQAGDDVNLLLGSTVSASGTLTITGGFGDLDNHGSVTAFGALAGSTVNIGGSSGEDDFFINPSSAPATVNVSGLAGNDDFFITMNATTAFNIDGGIPVLPTLPGDSLTVDFPGAVNVIFTPGAPGSGTFTASNRQTITFVSIETLNLFDYGDAPNTFATLQASGGPRHRFFPTGLHIGAKVDFDPDGQPSAAATGDDTDIDGDDEDGTSFLAPLIPHLNAVAVVNSSGAGFVDAWVDFNGNGTFGAGEQIAASFPVVAGNNNILFTVPANTASGIVISRFRLSSVGGLAPTGQAEDGEVEDRTVKILACPDDSVQVVADPVNPGQKILLVCGTNGNDVYVIEPRPDNLTQVRVKSTGKVIGIVNNSQFQSITAFGKAGNDTIIVDAHINKPAQLFGDAGDDQLYGAGGADRIYGGDGNDKLYGGNNNDILTGNAGNDFLYGQNGNDTLTGNDGNDQMWGDAGSDRLFGGNGNDVLAGGDGNDSVFGGAGDDKVYGDGGYDIVVGENGNDLVYGGQGRDVLIGGNGSDTLFGEQGDDILVAGPTSYDNNQAALQGILNEWASGHTYNARVNNIRTGGGFTGGFAFNAGTVFGDGAVDTLWGKEDQDWFLIGASDILKDKAANELVN